MKEKIMLNPISDVIKSSMDEANEKVKIAVPFISSFAKNIIDKKNIRNVQDKRLVTRFDERNLNTFDLPTLAYLLDCGFKICYNNNIHLKLYITDNKTFITSSNLTTGGFENNIELTVSVDTQNFENCDQIFEKLWSKSQTNLITKSLIDKNWDKFEILKKRERFEGKIVPKVNVSSKVGELNIQVLIDEIFNSKKDYSKTLEKTYKANNKRNEIIELIKNQKFDPFLFYSPKDHPNRYDNLFYNFVYGVESKLAGTGLRETQFKGSFEHPDFKKVINYLIPESISLEPWNLNDNQILFNFCIGLFDFNIPQYLEAIPIRLASYFYPTYFLPIFNLNHLKKICDSIGIETNAKTKGERFYAYNLFLKDKFKDIPYDNYIKSDMLYQLLYSVELSQRINNGENLESIKNSYKKIWIKNYIEGAITILNNTNLKK